ncbi:16447_t:CDS:1, partial [Funneliformis mosseae]
EPPQADPLGGGDDPMSQIILQDRRHRNLLASKKYRAKKQQMEREKNDLIQKLSNENQSLKRRVQEMEFENKSLKEIMNRLTTSSAASVLDNKVMMVRERLCRSGAVEN